jgi:cytochrome c-type biogenesis protein CcmF
MSPVAVVGTIAVLLAFLVAAWCVAAGILGNVRKNPRLIRSAVYGLYGFTALAGLAAALIIYGFVTHDFAIKYVAATSDTSMSVAYKITSFWGGLDGSLLFWVVVLALFSTVAVKVNYRRHRDMIGYVVATIMVVQVFFLALLVFNKNPFATFLTEPPPDGKGLNPLLQNYWMVIHPPSLYIGFVAATIPFAFAIGALASGRLDDMWLGSVRSWMLICFFFLSFGLILGGRWAYEELGWGGYWAWDPVENAGFLPWFTATAFLHASIIQEQRGMMKTWNLGLVILTFFLTIYGTFMTRAGVVQSVHAFGEDNELALQFIIFMVFILVVSFGLVIYRSNKLGAKNQFESFMSREFAFLLNNWILLGSAFFVLFATMFPTISEAFDDERVSVGPEFFNRWMTPLGLVLLFLAGAAPLLAYRRTTRERLWNQFLIPLASAAVVMALLAALVPKTLALTPIFAKGVNLPIPLITFGMIAFVFASVGQEFWRGMIVRRKQTGSDAITSMIGLVLTKRRKYGGYVVHLGVAVLFLGFVGKAYEGMTDRTIDRPAQVRTAVTGELSGLERQQYVVLGSGHELRDGREVAVERLVKLDDPAWFSYRGYRFLYERLVETHDDNKSAVTATVSVWIGDWKRGANGAVEWRNLTKIATGDPAKFDYHRGEQPTTEVSIHPRLLADFRSADFSEDVYLVLTGFGLEARLANFRIYINPLINFVWAGFVLFAFGVFIGLIPQGLVDRLSPPPRTRLGRAADLVAMLVLVGGIVLGTAQASYAGAPGPVRVAQAGGGQGGQGEHEQQGKPRMGHDDGLGYAHKFRPETPTATHLMKELICMCGGCQRETLFECKCAFAADERRRVLELLADLTSRKLSDTAVTKRVIQAFVAEYGGGVLATPRSKMSWLFPSVAVIGGLGLLFAVGYRWVSRGKTKLAAASAAVEDDTYAERLDDELRDTD